MLNAIKTINDTLDNNESFRNYAYKLGKQSILLATFVWIPFYAIVLAYALGKASANKKEETNKSTEPEKEQ